MEQHANPTATLPRESAWLHIASAAQRANNQPARLPIHEATAHVPLPEDNRPTGRRYLYSATWLIRQAATQPARQPSEQPADQPIQLTSHPATGQPLPPGNRRPAAPPSQPTSRTDNARKSTSQQASQPPSQQRTCQPANQPTTINQRANQPTHRPTNQPRIYQPDNQTKN